MKTDSKIQVATVSKEQADVYLQLGNVGRAFAHYLFALNLVPEWKNELKTTFSSTLCAWGEYLELQHRYSDLFTCYEQAIIVFPENEDVLGNLGAHLLRLGHFHEASHYFKQALQLNPDYLAAQRNLQSISNFLVERWHFRMLNDNNRNESFREAILKKVKQGFIKVLDIGTGSGIFCLYAVNSGAKNVYGCDCSTTMCDVAKQVLAANNVSKKVEVISKHSTDLLVPKDISQKVSLVVTETMDAGLFGEHLLQTLLHAWGTLLLPPHPYLSTIYDPAHRKADQTHGIVIPFGATLWATSIQCEYIARKNFVLTDRYGGLDFTQVTLFVDRDEPYDTENLYYLKNFKTITDPVLVTKINFNDPSELLEYYDGNRDRVVNFLCPSKDVDAIAVWFDLQLDEDITLSSSPFHSNAETCCWDQAIFPIRSSIDEENLELRFKFKHGKLSVEGPAVIVHDNAGDKETVRSPRLPVSQEMIKFLNNKTLCDRLLSLPSELVEQPQCALDMSPFPLVGLSLLASSQAHVVSVVKSPNDIIAVQNIAEKNNICTERLNCVLEENFESFLNNVQLKFDLIINNLVDSSGELKERNVAVIPLLKYHLLPGGLMLPQSLTICCRLVESEWLTKASRVVDEDIVDTYKIAQFINKYQVYQQLDVDLNLIEYTPASAPVECLILNMSTLGQIAALAKELPVNIDCAAKVNGIPYWFQYNMFQNDGKVISSLSSDSHTNQSVMLVDPVDVTAGGKVLLRINYQCGILKIMLLPTPDMPVSDV